MNRDIQVKICGLRTEEEVDTAVDAGAEFIGLVFVRKSPRFVDLDMAARLADRMPGTVARVALVLDADDAALDEITQSVPLDMLQLHGAETPDRVAEIRARYGLNVMKAIGVADQSDLDAIDRYAPVVDQLLIDAKPPQSGDLPGGNGLPFDWRLLAGKSDWPVPWMLAGGLTAENVADAIAMTGTRIVDVSSGVERAPGVKDPAKIRAFLRAVHG